MALWVDMFGIDTPMWLVALLYLTCWATLSCIDQENMLGIFGVFVGLFQERMALAIRDKMGMLDNGQHGQVFLEFVPILGKIH